MALKLHQSMEYASLSQRKVHGDAVSPRPRPTAPEGSGGYGVYIWGGGSGMAIIPGGTYNATVNHP